VLLETESSLEFMLQVLLEPRKQSTYCIRMLARIHVAIFLRTATKNKKLLAGGIQSESSRSNCDVANLVTTAKKTQCDGWKYQKALDRIAVASFRIAENKYCWLEE
jgi:hypothetical protein